jgi:hypothetical protein
MRWNVMPSWQRGSMGERVRRSPVGMVQRRRWDAVSWARGRFIEETKAAPQVDGYAAFLSRLRSLGPVEDTNVLTGEEMMNPQIEAMIDRVEIDTGPMKAERVEALQDYIAGREPVSVVLSSYLEANPKRSPTTTLNLPQGGGPVDQEASGPASCWDHAQAGAGVDRGGRQGPVR